MERVDSFEERLLPRLVWRIRLRRVAIMLVGLLLCIGLIRIAYRYWRRAPLVSDRSFALLSRTEASGKAGIILPEQPDYNFSHMVALMDEYVRLVAVGRRAMHEVAYVGQMKKLLADLLEEHEGYIGFLDREHKSQVPFETRRTKKASLHYLRSMENAIVELQRMLREAK